MKFFVRGLIGPLFLSSLALSYEFTSPIFERLNPLEIVSEYEKRQKTLSDTDLFLLELFIAERMELDGKIHESKSFLDKIIHRCDSTDTLTSRAQLVCAIALTWKATKASPIRQMILVNRIKGLLEGALSAATRADGLYAKGRIYYALPPSMGQNVGRSLLSFELLRKFKSKPTSFDYWTGRIYELQGKPSAARKSFERALGGPRADVRTRLYLKGRARHLSLKRLDTPSFGFRPSLSLSSGEGLGARVTLFDDQLFDTNRRAAVSASVTSRGSWSARVRFEDASQSKSLKWAFEATEAREKIDFYGYTIAAPNANRTEVSTHSNQLDLAATVFLTRELFASSGIRYRMNEIFSPSIPSSNDAGLVVALGWDSRDSRVDPYRGVKASVKGYFPSRAFSSSTEYQQWKAHWVSYHRIGRKHQLSPQVAFQMSTSGAPFAAQASLGGEFKTPGFRRGRYRDNMLYAGSIEYRYRISRPISLFVFSSFGRVGDHAAALFGGAPKVGGGGGALLYLSSARSAAVRAELGAVSDEWNFVVRGDLSL